MSFNSYANPPRLNENLPQKSKSESKPEEEKQDRSMSPEPGMFSPIKGHGRQLRKMGNEVTDKVIEEIKELIERKDIKISFENKIGNKQPQVHTMPQILQPQDLEKCAETIGEILGAKVDSSKLTNKQLGTCKAMIEQDQVEYSLYEAKMAVDQKKNEVEQIISDIKEEDEAEELMPDL